MTFRPTWYPCSDPKPHAEHQHNEGPDNYTYLCAGRDEPTEPTYTASEVKVLTETASKVAYALGRKDAVEEINQWIFDQQHKRGTNGAKWNAYMNVAAQLRNIASQPPSATSDATSGVPGHQEVSEAVRSPQEAPKLVCRRCFGYGIVTNHGMSTPCPDCAKGNTP